jgi:dihydroorotase
VGLETCVPLVFDRLVHRGIITMPRFVELLSLNPARILRRQGGTLTAGAAADITVLAPDARVTIRAAALRSKSKNTPFDGWELRGAAAATIGGGRTVFVNDSVTGADVFA